MDRIIVDDAFTNQLPDGVGPCVVFNSAGKRLGYFCPEHDPVWYEGLESSVSDEELERRERAGGGRSLAEILSGLSKSSNDLYSHLAT
jgi:hypothetical protein